MRVEGLRPLIKIKGMTNWEIIEQSIREKKIIELGILEQHFTTSCKLHTARNHLVKLGKLIPTKRITDLPVEIEVDEQKNVKSIVWHDTWIIKAEKYFEEFDGFFYSLRGCLDSFFWEINLIFKLGLKKITYAEVKKAVKKKHNEKATTKLLEKLENEHWFRYVSEVRNELTHHTLSEFITFTEDLMIYLPSDPKRNEYLREERYEVLTCLKTLADNTLEFLEKGYEAMMFDLNIRPLL